VNTAASPASNAGGANCGKRASCARSGTETSSPDLYANRHGPCPDLRLQPLIAQRRLVGCGDVTRCELLVDQRHARCADREDLHDPLHQVVQDRLDREVGDHGPSKIAQDGRQVVPVNHCRPIWTPRCGAAGSGRDTSSRRDTHRIPVRTGQQPCSSAQPRNRLHEEDGGCS
jgi:hypothetical protein